MNNIFYMDDFDKLSDQVFTSINGFITDYFAEVMRELRKTSYADAHEKYFRLGNQLNQRDTIAVKRTISGLTKLIYSHGEYTKEDIERILRFSLEMRRRVKEQLKKIGGMEFYDVNFSYIDNETFSEEYVPVPEQSGGTLIPDGIGKPGHLYNVSRGDSGMLGVFKLETQMTSGSGKFERTGIGTNSKAKESVDNAYKYLKANVSNISGNISTTTKDYLVHVQDLNGIGMTIGLTLPTIIAVCSVALGKPVLTSMAVLGDVSIGGTLIKVEELANILQVCQDSGAKKVLLPLTSAVDLGTVPPELVGTFNLIFYKSAEDAVFKALGVE